MMYAARYLAPANFGILSFAIAFTGIFAIFGDFGLQPLMVREIARDRTIAPKYLANVSLMKVMLVAVAFGLIALTINLIGYPEETINVVYLFGLSFVFQASSKATVLKPNPVHPFSRHSRISWRHSSTRNVGTNNWMSILHLLAVTTAHSQWALPAASFSGKGKAFICFAIS
jgi:hypothetical protein